MATRCMLFVSFIAALVLDCGIAKADEAVAPATRPFHLGFTRWPADLSLEGFTTAQDFAHEHGDIVSVMFIGGIPWPESLDGKPFSKDVQDNLKYRPPKGKKIFLSISPLDKERKAVSRRIGARRTTCRCPSRGTHTPSIAPR